MSATDIAYLIKSVTVIAAALGQCLGWDGEDRGLALGEGDAPEPRDQGLAVVTVAPR